MAGTAASTDRLNNLATRWALRCDMPEIMAIEDACFQWDAWTEADIAFCLRQMNVVPWIIVAGKPSRQVGYCFYGLEADHVQILRLAVHPDFQGRGAGTAAIDWLVAKLGPETRRQQIMADVPERDIAVCEWFYLQGFRGELVRGWDKDSGDDGIRFVWTVP